MADESSSDVSNLSALGSSPSEVEPQSAAELPAAVEPLCAPQAKSKADGGAHAKSKADAEAQAESKDDGGKAPIVVKVEQKSNCEDEEKSKGGVHDVDQDKEEDEATVDRKWNEYYAKLHNAGAAKRPEAGMPSTLAQASRAAPAPGLPPPPKSKKVEKTVEEAGGPNAWRHSPKFSNISVNLSKHSDWSVEEWDYHIYGNRPHKAWVVPRYGQDRKVIRCLVPTTILQSRHEFRGWMGMPMPMPESVFLNVKKINDGWYHQSHGKMKMCDKGGDCDRRTCGYAHFDWELYWPRLEEEHNARPCKFFLKGLKCYKGQACALMHNDFNKHGFGPDSMFAGQKCTEQLTRVFRMG